MKKTIVALAILLTCMGFIPIDAANWYWIGADSSGNQWYIDNQSASKSYDVAVVWVKTVREDGTYNLCQLEITRDRKMAILQAAAYNADHEPINLYTVDTWQKKYDAVHQILWEKQFITRFGRSKNYFMHMGKRFGKESLEAYALRPLEND